MDDVVCDGCGKTATADHIRKRIQRLEMATRYRPPHIGLLFLAEAPPPRLEDYFYYPAPQRSERTGLSRVLFDELMRGLGIAAEEAATDEAALAEFQRRGFFFTDCMECPLEEVGEGLASKMGCFELAHRYGPTTAKRIQLSYKPRRIILLSTRTRYLIPVFQQAGLGDLLLLYQGLPLHFPHPHNPVAQEQFRTGLSDVLARATARLPT